MPWTVTVDGTLLAMGGEVGGVAGGGGKDELDWRFEMLESTRMMKMMHAVADRTVRSLFLDFALGSR